MTNNILQKAHQVFLSCLLGIGITFSAQGQGLTIQTTIDSNCLVQISLVDTAGLIVSNQPPYLFSVAGINYNSNSVAIATIDLSNSQNGAHILTIIDGGQNSYTNTVTTNCNSINNLPNPVTPSISNASNCNQCDGTASFQINNPPFPPYTFTWDDGFVHIGTTFAQRNNLCTGVYTVWVQDTVGNNFSMAVTVGCTGAISPQSAVCYQNKTIDLGSNISQLLLPQDLSPSFIQSNTSAYIIDPWGNISTYYTLSCNNLGYNNFTLLFIDSVLQTSDTCNVLLRVTDTLNICNGSGNLNYQIQGISSNATTCNSCTGQYVLQSILDSVHSTTAPQPYAFLWSDGSTQGPTRTGLCPNQNYVLNITDANGNVYSEIIHVGCNNPVGIQCIDTSRIVNNLVCSAIIAPVCGCDSVTYQNSCIAERQNGISSWTTGVCGANSLILSVSTTPASCDTAIFCNGSAFVSVSGGIGGYSYAWSSDTTILTSNINNLCAGTYTVTVMDANGNTGTAFVIIGYSSCVWPGDTDDNTVANNFDLLPIALTYNDFGPARTFITTSWAAQTAMDWQSSNILGLANPKHIDCDGNGVIDSNDVTAIFQNYGQSYFRSANSSLFGSIPFYIQSASASLGDTLSLDILLGDQANQVSNAYAVAFTLNYDTAVVEAGTIAASFNGSWLGNDLLEIQQDFSVAGQVEIAIGRKNKTPINGFGPLGSIAFTIKDDVIIGKVNAADTTITATIGISAIRLIDHQNNEIGTNPQTCVLEISERLNINNINNNLAIHLFPNPTKGTLNISSEAVDILSVNLYTATGQLVYQQNNIPSHNHQIQTDNLPTGVYFISIQTNKGVYNNKVQVVK